MMMRGEREAGTEYESGEQEAFGENSAETPVPEPVMKMQVREGENGFLDTPFDPIPSCPIPASHDIDFRLHCCIASILPARTSTADPPSR